MKILRLTLRTAAALASFLCFFGDSGIVEAARPEAKVGKMSCRSCHSDLSSLIPKEHQPVKNGNLSSCFACHKADASGKATKNSFSSSLHRPHINVNGTADCMMCHIWVPGKSFGLVGRKGSFGSPSKDEIEETKKIFVSWKSSGYTDSLHGKANVSCGGCHGGTMAKEGNTVENSRCLTCHGPIEKLAERSAPKDFPDRNPHKSHLGDIDCTVCHKGHAESKTYCLDCHKTFKIKQIPGGAVHR